MNERGSKGRQRPGTCRVPCTGEAGAGPTQPQEMLGDLRLGLQKNAGRNRRVPGGGMKPTSGPAPLKLHAQGAGKAPGLTGREATYHFSRLFNKTRGAVDVFQAAHRGAGQKF